MMHVSIRLRSLVLRQWSVWGSTCVALSVRVISESGREMSWSCVELIVFALVNVLIKVVYREPVTGSRSRGIVNQHPAINNKLEAKPTPKPNPTLTLTLNLNYTSSSTIRGKPIARLLIAWTSTPFWLITPTALGAHSLVRMSANLSDCRYAIRGDWGSGAGYRNPIHYV